MPHQTPKTSKNQAGKLAKTTKSSKTVKINIRQEFLKNAKIFAQTGQCDYVCPFKGEPSVKCLRAQKMMTRKAEEEKREKRQLKRWQAKEEMEKNLKEKSSKNPENTEKKQLQE